MRRIFRLFLLCLIPGYFLLCLHGQEGDAVLSNPRPMRIHSAAEIAQRAQPSIVQILSKDKDGRTTVIGSGFAVSPIIILTISHLAPGDAAVMVKAPGSGDPVYSEGVLRRDEAHDLVLLSVPALELKPVALSYNNVSAGEHIYLMDPAGGPPASGQVADARGAADDGNLQITASIPPASSGAPVLDAYAKIAGIADNVTRDGKAVSFVVPAQVIRELTKPSQTGAQEILAVATKEYKDGSYEDAAMSFTEAIALDPSLTIARLGLGNTEMIQLIPDDALKQNTDTAQSAIDAYLDVLDDDPGNLSILRNVETAYLDVKKFDDARAWEKKIQQALPNDPDVYYQLGLIDAKQAADNTESARYHAGLLEEGKQNASLPPADCAALTQANQDLIADGMDKLQLALRLKPSLADAMYYISVLYQQKAELACGDSTAKQANTAAADEWLAKAKANGSEAAVQIIGVIGGVLANPSN